jgi:N-methylhydantoinase A
VPRFQAGRWLVTTPSLDLVEIGAGGGSIAWIDKSGLLKVGPQSAGADPGPACYPDGGELPTVTDADVALGWLNPDFFVGGKFRLNAAAAAKAISSHIAEPLKLELIEAANGIIKIVSSEMVEALRLVTASRGEDPREYVLVAFGGAGPVHAALLAEELRIPRVLCRPRRASIRRWGCSSPISSATTYELIRRARSGKGGRGCRGALKPWKRWLNRSSIRRVFLLIASSMSAPSTSVTAYK